ncbi:hypothetical protein [Streptomyces europaeiscabiei]|uniref:hypothetical protein n=1 Tax=Streptomyces europaeiscabiei TaxID=146819 RepID=UPI002E127F6E|nr:hypothetical protein OHB30_31225 [Streptomyces europaeiscabiei]
MRIRTVLPTALLAVSGLLSGAGTTFAAGTGEEPSKDGGYPAYQCFETVGGQYCSDMEVKNDAEGATWIWSCPSDVLKGVTSKPYLRDPRPEDALSCSGEESPEAIDYPAFQCFKTPDRVEYCSDKKVKNHDLGNAWIKTCPPAVLRNISTFLANNRPGGALSC